MGLNFDGKVLHWKKKKTKDNLRFDMKRSKVVRACMKGLNFVVAFVGYKDMFLKNICIFECKILNEISCICVDIDSLFIPVNKSFTDCTVRINNEEEYFYFTLDVDLARKSDEMMQVALAKLEEGKTPRYRWVAMSFICCSLFFNLAM